MFIALTWGCCAHIRFADGCTDRDVVRAIPIDVAFARLILCFEGFPLRIEKLTPRNIAVRLSGVEVGVLCASNYLSLKPLRSMLH